MQTYIIARTYKKNPTGFWLSQTKKSVGYSNIGPELKMTINYSAHMPNYVPL